jgi:hypothetical protein
LISQNYNVEGWRRFVGVVFLFLAPAVAADAQIVESVGSRALGMGGAFVAVASDSTATWWNPAGIAAGPFVDLGWGRDRVEVTEQAPAWRHKTTWYALGTPTLGLSYYRFRITDVQPLGPIASVAGSRPQERGDVPVQSVALSQLGVTIVRTLISGVHVGTTLKHVRGTVRSGPFDRVVESAASLSAALEQGDALEGGEAENRFDLDVGLIAVAGPLRLGAVVRNVREPEFFTSGDAPDALATGMRLPRQVRLGAAFDGAAVGSIPLTVAVDADLQTYVTTSGERRMIALGVEQWILGRRLGVRVGGRVNTRGARERVATGGLTVAAGGGLYLDGYAVRGGTEEERGWGLATRISF